MRLTLDLAPPRSPPQIFGSHWNAATREISADEAQRCENAAAHPMAVLPAIDCLKIPACPPGLNLFSLSRCAFCPLARGGTSSATWFCFEHGCQALLLLLSGVFPLAYSLLAPAPFSFVAPFPPGASSAAAWGWGVRSGFVFHALSRLCPPSPAPLPRRPFFPRRFERGYVAKFDLPPELMYTIVNIEEDVMGQ